MKALTIWQPFASLIMCESKRFETRGWSTRHRGPLLIHSAKRYHKHERAEALYFHQCGHLDVPPGEMPLGSLLGVCRVTEMHDAGNPALEAAMTRYERHFGDFRLGRYAWALDDVRRFDEPVPWRGQQGLWSVEREDLPDHAQRTIDDLT